MSGGKTIRITFDGKLDDFRYPPTLGLPEHTSVYCLNQVPEYPRVHLSTLGCYGVLIDLRARNMPVRHTFVRACTLPRAYHQEQLSLAIASSLNVSSTPHRVRACVRACVCACVRSCVVLCCVRALCVHMHATADQGPRQRAPLGCGGCGTRLLAPVAAALCVVACGRIVARSTISGQSGLHAIMR